MFSPFTNEHHVFCCCPVFSPFTNDLPVRTFFNPMKVQSEAMHLLGDLSHAQLQPNIVTFAAAASACEKAAKRLVQATLECGVVCFSLGVCSWSV